MRDDKGRIADILEAIERIEQVCSRGKMAFLDDEMIQVWIVYHLQIAGEAARGISPACKEKYRDIPWTEIIGMRNILVHRYFGIDKEAVWRVVERDLPVLKKQLEQIIS